MAKGQVLVAGDRRHIHRVLLGGAGGRSHRTLLDGLLTAAGAVKAVAVLGGLVALAAQRALAQCAPRVTVEVGLTAARLDFLHEADVAASACGGTAAAGIVPAPVLHLAVGAEAPVVRLPLEGPIVDLDRKGVSGLVRRLTGVLDLAVHKGSLSCALVTVFRGSGNTCRERNRRHCLLAILFFQGQVVIHCGI